MNIFFLSLNPMLCAMYHFDVHVIKMILEYAQLLSTAHRVLDGEEKIEKTKNGRNIKRYKFKSYDDREKNLYKCTHINHPCSIWTRESSNNYKWLYKLFCYLCDEYTKRYNKVHKTDTKLRSLLQLVPWNIQDYKMTTIHQAMPLEYQVDDNPITAYRIFYIFGKYKITTWKFTNKPWWFVDKHIYAQQLTN